MSGDMGFGDTGFGDTDAELIQEFIQESLELLDDVEPTLLTLERHRSQEGRVDHEVINRVFRAFHSIKGSGSFLGLQHLVKVTHIAETLLDDLRSESYDLAEDHVTVLCDALDFSRDALAEVAATSTDAALADRAVTVTATIRAEIDRSTRPERTSAAQAAPDLPDAAAEPPPASAEAPPFLDDSLVMFGSVSETDQPNQTETNAKLMAAEPPPSPPAALASIEANPPSVAEANHAPPIAQEPSTAVPSSPTQRRRAPTRATIRVDVVKLDALMNLVGELILAENAVTHHESVEELDEVEGFHKAAMHLNQVTRSLQDIAMSVRMLPIAGTFHKMQRLVRDLAHKQGKDVELVLSGEGTEVDKNLIEGIADPLVHIMRNAVDHGIETTEERIAAGKPARGTVHLEAAHRGGEVWITVRDDGKGLDPAKLTQKAIERGVLPSDAEPTPEEAYRLIFAAGFSTAEVVTDVSGRGVGMDVVRRNIEALKGRIDVDSQIGVGSSFTLRIPLTLAIIDGMLVQVGPMRYTVPLLSIQESVTVSDSSISVLPDGRELARIRGAFLPVVRLSQLHGVPSEVDPYRGGILVAVEAGRRAFALHVDRLIGQRQTVIKALPSYLGHLEGLAGCSILSNGDISLILDLAGLDTAPQPTEIAA